MADFIDLVHNLPPELFNEIEKLVFAPSNGVVVLHENYAPPSLLYIDRKTRARYANSYYKQVRYESHTPEYLFRWLANLNQEHRNLISWIQLMIDVRHYPADSFSPLWSDSPGVMLREAKREIFKEMLTMFERFGMHFSNQELALTYDKLSLAARDDWREDTAREVKSWAFAINFLLGEFDFERREFKEETEPVTYMELREKATDPPHSRAWVVATRKMEPT